MLSLLHWLCFQTLCDIKTNSITEGLGLIYFKAYLSATLCSAIIMYPTYYLMVLLTTARDVKSRFGESGVDYKLRMKRNRPKFWDWEKLLYHFFVGCSERAIALTLLIWLPSKLVLFVGGWTTLKIAAAWGRQRDAKDSRRHVLALVGSAMSFSIAVGVGLLFNPNLFPGLSAASD